MAKFYLVQQHMKPIGKYKEAYLYSDKYDNIVDAEKELNSIIQVITNNKNWTIDYHEYDTYDCKYYDSVLNNYIYIDYTIISISDK